jgi:hypothetical protein
LVSTQLPLGFRLVSTWFPYQVSLWLPHGFLMAPGWFPIGFPFGFLMVSPWVCTTASSRLRDSVAACATLLRVHRCLCGSLVVSVFVCFLTVSA